jgi:hypothetical protein
MNNLQDLIKRLSAIGQVTEAEEKCSECGCTPCECDDKDKVDEAKKPDADKDGVPDWADKKPGKDDNEEKVDEGAMDKLKNLGKKALDTLGHKDDEELIKDMQKQQGQEPTGKKPEPVKEDTTLSVLRHLAGIQETKIEEDDVEEGNEFSGALKAAKDAGQEEFEVAGKKYKVNECGEDYPSSGQMSPMTMTGQEQPHMGIPAEVMANIAGQEQGPEMAQPEIAMAAPEAPKATYTLSIQNGENNLQMTTDMPDEIIHIMKLAGVNKGAEVTKTEAPEGNEEQNEAPKKEVEEEWGNTPGQTNQREPKAFGDIRDWGQKGTGKGQADSAGRKPFGQGDNPLGEQAMMEAYKKFKASK